MDQLVGASEADPDKGFMARLMALCSLPRTNPGNRKEYKRVNGPYRLYMQAGPENKLPYGSLPRLLLAWVSTEVVRTQSRELILGSSLAEFMRKLGISSDSGGSRGERTRLRNQMTASSFGGTSASPTSGCCGTAKSASVKTSLTRSSTTPYQLNH